MAVVRRGTGLAHLVGGAGLLVGRSAQCDILIADERVSRQQALIIEGTQSYELLVVGRHETYLNGRLVRGGAALQHGDRIAIADELLDFDSDEDTSPGRGWLLRLPSDLLVGIMRRTTRVGGDSIDDVQIQGMPPGAFVLHRPADELHVEARVDLELGGQPVEAGSVERVADGDEIVVGDVQLTLMSASLEQTPTVGSTASVTPLQAITFSFLPNGGRLELRFAPRSRVVVELSELRARLVAVLLNPPGDYAAGDHIPDELVQAAVWPGERDRNRGHVNQLVHRLRRQLLHEGLEPTRLVDRARKGGSTCMRVPLGCRVSVS